ncbi:uncharacterized protein BX663DRAFT_445777 [Cokeromyces recurvatus]|uniref:uncharacterized protein n=1 Tax=Cokeromyces recurvatus TaxID=90255 RepID=UPI002220B8E1|nr:uncharacterized protein BX663DRAFT_445777 [Cokeromyces recurvatus]KAI7907821.1 hypothetical protein BX663DRAFT_445777 [Cokeromyces recurvatus]
MYKYSCSLFYLFCLFIYKLSLFLFIFNSFYTFFFKKKVIIRKMNNKSESSSPCSLSISISAKETQHVVEPNHEIQQLANKKIPSTRINSDMNACIHQFSLNDTTSSSEHKVFTCNDCGQEFNRAYNLKSHKATHSASKSFQCSECQKQFLRLHDLKRHQKLHTGEKPYRCSICYRSFSRLDALKRHKKAEEERSNCTIRNYHVYTSSSPPSSMLTPSKSTTTSKGSLSFITSEWQQPSISPPKNVASNQVYLPFILPSHQSDPNELETLRQRIHDLEIENRVLRSLIHKEDEELAS